MIGFASPGLAVAGTLCVALPVLVHLVLRRRRRPYEWAAMDLLREAIRRVERRRRLERWLLLAVRCLVVALAAGAIAGPFIGSAIAAGRRARTLVIVVDDGAASNERVDGGTALSVSVAAARALIDGLAPGDRVAIVRSTRPGDGAGEPASMDVSGSVRRLDALSSSEVAGDLASAIAAACAVLAHPEAAGTVRELFVASALREGSVRAFPPLPAARDEDAPIQVWLMPTPAASGDNLRISSIRAERPAGAASDAAPVVKVVVERDRGDAAVTRTVRVLGPTLASPGERVVTLSPGERAREITVPVIERAGGVEAARTRPCAIIATIETDAQPIDDARATVLSATERIRAVIVDRRTFDGAGIDRLSQGDWIARALAPSDPPAVDVVLVDPASFDTRSCATADLVVVAQPHLLGDAQWRVLAAFVERGGSCVVLPAARERVHAWTRTMRDVLGMPWQASVDALDLPDPASVEAVRRESGTLSAIMAELPQLAGAVDVSRMLRVDVAPSDASVVLSAPGAGAVVTQWSPTGARGLVTLFAAAMDPAWTTIPLKPLMVPLWQEIAAESRRRAGSGLQATVGSMALIDRPGIAELRPVGFDGAPLAGVRAVPVGAGGRMIAAVERAGTYEMVDSRGDPRGAFVVTIDPATSSVRPSDPERAATWLSTVGTISGLGVERDGSEATATDEGPTTAIAAWMLAACLALAVLESVLARRFSHARPSGSGPVHASVRIAAGRAA
jgi:hypothetical protein